MYFRFLTNPAGDLKMKQWATEGLAYLTLDADVKEDVVNDPKALTAIVQAAKVTGVSLYQKNKVGKSWLFDMSYTAHLYFHSTIYLILL